ncbi:MAG TPA: hypothetical protein VIR58_09680 [Acidimicrobiales bacterium]
MSERQWPKILDARIRERDEAPLDDEALLVRGGQFRVAHVLARAEACHRRLGFPGVSVAHAATGLLVDLCEMSPRLLDYDECAVTTVGRVRQRFEVAPTGASPHFSIVLPAADLASVRALRELFEVGIDLPSPLDDR